MAPFSLKGNVMIKIMINYPDHTGHTSEDFDFIMPRDMYDAMLKLLGALKLEDFMQGWHASIQSKEVE